MIGAGVLTTPGFMAMDLRAVVHPARLGGRRRGGTVRRARVRRGRPRDSALGWRVPLSVDAVASDARLPRRLHVADRRVLAAGGTRHPARRSLRRRRSASTSIGGSITVAAIVLVTALHAFDLRASRGGQNILVAVKLTLVVGFVVVGLVAGSNSWPTWVARRVEDRAPARAVLSQPRVHRVLLQRLERGDLRERGVRESAPRRAACDADRLRRRDRCSTSWSTGCSSRT